MGYDVDSAFIFAYRLLNCDSCCVKARDFLDDENIDIEQERVENDKKAAAAAAAWVASKKSSNDNNNNNNTAKPSTAASSSAPAPSSSSSLEENEDNLCLCRLDYFLKNTCPPYLRDMCPVILSKKVCFTKALRDEFRDAAESRSNVHEAHTHTQLVRRHADKHLSRVNQLFEYVLYHSRCSKLYHQTVETTKKSSRVVFPSQNQPAIDTFKLTMPKEADFARYLRDFFDPNTKELLTRPLYRTPSETYLRMTVLMPYLNTVRNVFERILERVPLTQMIKGDSTYKTPGRMLGRNSGRMFRSSF